MEKESKLNRIAFRNYKNSRLSSWLLGMTTAILIAAILAIDLAVPLVGFISVPLLILPIIFAGMLQHAFAEKEGTLTVRGSIVSFGLYFSPLFRGIFRYFLSMVKSILIFIVFEMTISFITSTIYQTTTTGFMDAVNQLYESIYSENFSLDMFNNLLLANNMMLFKYFATIIIPSYFMAMIFLIYNFSRNSIITYYLLDNKKGSPQLARYVYSDVLRYKRFPMLGDYLSLNWPLFLLLIIGYAGGSVLGYYWKHDIFTMIALGNILGMLLNAFFLPFYFSNQEVLYNKYKPYFDNGTKNVTTFMLQNIQRNIDLSNEEKERLQASLMDENGDEESNKKDSEEP